MPVTTTIYSIWGRWMGTREICVAVLDLWDDRDAVLAEAIADYGEHWQLWLEARPREHPWSRLQRRLNGEGGPHGRKPLRLRLANHEGHVEGWNEPTLHVEFGKNEHLDKAMAPVEGIAP